MINGTIYKITCLATQKCYIGQTQQSVELRWQCHITGNGSKPLYNAIEKHGFEMFRFETLHEGITCREELNRLEIALIAEHGAYESGYNRHIGGQDEFRYSEVWEHSDEICRLYTEDLKPLQKIADMFDTNKVMIRAILEANGIERRDNKSHVWEHAEEICRLYTIENKSSIQIAETYDVHTDTIRNILESNGIRRKPTGRHITQKTWQYQSEICYLYTIEMKPLERIAKQFGTNHMQIKRVLKANGIKFRKYSPRKRAINQQLTFDFEM